MQHCRAWASFPLYGVPERGNLRGESPSLVSHFLCTHTCLDIHLKIKYIFMNEVMFFSVWTLVSRCRALLSCRRPMMNGMRWTLVPSLLYSYSLLFKIMLVGQTCWCRRLRASSMAILSSSLYSQSCRSVDWTGRGPSMTSGSIVLYDEIHGEVAFLSACAWSGGTECGCVLRVDWWRGSFLAVRWRPSREWIQEIWEPMVLMRMVMVVLGEREDDGVSEWVMMRWRRSHNVMQRVRE